MFSTTISFMDFGPKWKSLQTYTDQTSAVRLSGADAIVQSLGMHLPFTLFASSLPMLPNDLPVVRSDELVSKLLALSSQRSFKQACFLLYIRMHVFTSMRRDLTDGAHHDTNITQSNVARCHVVDRIEHGVHAALASVL